MKKVILFTSVFGLTSQAQGGAFGRDSFFDKFNELFAEMENNVFGPSMACVSSPMPTAHTNGCSVKSSYDYGAELPVDKDGKFVVELPKVEMPKAQGNTDQNILVNQKLLDENGSLEFRLCQLKESADNYERMVIISAKPMDSQHPGLMIDVDFSMSEHFKQESANDAKGRSMSFRSHSSSISRSSSYQVRVPEGFNADVEAVELVKDQTGKISGISVQLAKTETMKVNQAQQEPALEDGAQVSIDSTKSEANPFTSVGSDIDLEE